MKTREISAKCGKEKVKVLIVDKPGEIGIWWAQKGSHMARLLSRRDSRKLRSGVQVNNLSDLNVIKYYGNGRPCRNEAIDDMETLLRVIA